MCYSTLGDRVGLHVTIVVFASPDEFAAGFESISDHIVDKSVLVPDSFFLESRLELGFVDFGKDVLEVNL